MKFIIPSIPYEKGARILSFKVTQITILTKALKPTSRKSDYCLISGKRPPPLPLSFNNPIYTFNLAPRHQPQDFVSIFLLCSSRSSLSLSLSTSILKCFVKISE